MTNVAANASGGVGAGGSGVGGANVGMNIVGSTPLSGANIGVGVGAGASGANVGSGSSNATSTSLGEVSGGVGAMGSATAINHSWLHPTIELTGHRDGVWDVSTCRWDGRLLLSASADGRAILWDIRSLVPNVVYTGHIGSVNSARFHPSRPLFCTASGDRSVHVIKFVDSYTPSAMSFPRRHRPDDLSMAIGGAGAEMGGTDSGISANIPPSFQRTRSRSWPFKPMPELPAAKPQPPPAIVQPFESRIDTAGWATTLHSPQVEIKGFGGPVSAADWVAGGDLLACGSWDKTVRVFAVDQSSAQELHVMKGHEKAITNITTHYNMPFVLSSSQDGTFRMWDLRSNRTVFESHSGPVNSAVFSPNGELIASAGDDKLVHLWDRRSNKSPLSTAPCGVGANRLCFNPSGTAVTVPCDDGLVKTFNLRGEQLHELGTGLIPSSKRMVCASAWTYDESAVFCAGWQLAIFGWRQ